MNKLDIKPLYNRINEYVQSEVLKKISVSDNFFLDFVFYIIQNQKSFEMGIELFILFKQCYIYTEV